MESHIRVAILAVSATFSIVMALVGVFLWKVLNEIKKELKQINSKIVPECQVKLMIDNKMFEHANKCMLKKFYNDKE